MVSVRNVSDASHQKLTLANEWKFAIDYNLEIIFSRQTPFETFRRTRCSNSFGLYFRMHFFFFYHKTERVREVLRAITVCKQEPNTRVSELHCITVWKKKIK